MRRCFISVSYTHLDVYKRQVLVIGEAREWELVEYAADTITSGAKKGLIVLGHIPSEQGGMIYCAEWLRSFIPEVPIQFVATKEPFWTPDQPVEI